MDIKDSYLHGTVGVVKSISVDADKLKYKLADIAGTIREVTLPLVTTTANGLMSIADKKKLDAFNLGSLKNNLVLKINSGTTEGTNLYTYNGSTAKTLDIKNGAGIGFTNTAGSLQIYNSGVRAIATGTTNGTISVNTNGTSTDVAVKGLGSAAYISKDMLMIYKASGVGEAMCVNADLPTELSKLAVSKYIEYWDGSTGGNGWFNSKWGWIEAVNGFKGSLTGNASSATKLQTKRKLWGLDFDGTADVSGNMTGVGNITIPSSDVDRFISFTTVGNTHNWRLGYIGSGAGEANYLIFQSTKNASPADGWHDALKFGCETLTATFGGTVIAPTFQGNLDGTYVNKLTNYTIATAIGSIAATDSLNTALGKLEFKTNFIYNDLFGTDNDDVINKWHEIVDFIDSVKEGTDITDEFVTRKTNLTITGVKTFSQPVTINNTLKITSESNTKYILLGNLDSAGTNNPFVISSSNGRLEFNNGDSWSDNGGNLTSIIKFNKTGITSYTSINATKFITSGGTSSLFVKGDGSLDSNTYAKITDLLNYVPLILTTTAECNLYKEGLTIAKVINSDAGNTSNHSAFITITSIGTPFLLQLPDSNSKYIYKRYKSSGTWSSWFKLSAGYADSAAKWTTARTFIIGNTGKSVDGSANVSWSLAEIGASAVAHTHSVKINGTTKTIAASGGAAVDLGNYLPLSGGTMSGSIILKGSTSSDMTYGGNIHPYIRFDNKDSSQNISLIFTDYDSYRSPTGIKLIGNQGGEWFEAPNIYATNFYGNEFKKNGSSNDYVLLGGGGHKTISSIITSGYIGTTLVLTSSKVQALSGISSINGRVSISAKNDLTRIGFGGVHAVAFGEPGYAHRNYYFRPSYGTPGVTYTKVYIQNASASASPTWTTTHIFDFNGDAIHSGLVTSSGFKKNRSSDSYILLGGGGHKLISDFATSDHNHDGRYPCRFYYNLPSKKGVRISYSSYSTVLVTVNGTNSGAQLIIIGTGYGEGGRVRNQFTELVSCSAFDWSIPNSNSICCSVEIFSNRSQDNTEVCVISTSNITFIEIDALTSAKENAKLLNSSNYTNYTVKQDGTGAYGTWNININGNASTASRLKSIIVVDSKAFSLSNASWTDTGYTFASLATGTYAVQITFGTTLVASGIMSVYNNLSDTAGDEIPLHVYGTAGWRPYLRTYANKLLISSNDISATSRTITIKIALIL